MPTINKKTGNKNGRLTIITINEIWDSSLLIDTEMNAKAHPISLEKTILGQLFPVPYRVFCPLDTRTNEILQYYDEKIAVLSCV